MAIRCICVDDEAMARKGLTLALRPYDDFEMVAQYSSPETLIQNCPNNIDVLFIDIEMPRINGFELLSRLPYPIPQIIFVTAYNQYAIQAFEAQALDYVLKPIEEGRFFQVVERIRNQVEIPQEDRNNTELIKVIDALQQKIKKNDATISIKTDEGYFRVKLSDILFLESVGDHVCIHLCTEQLITRNTLKHYVAQLVEHGFHQIHKSSLINIKHVVKVSKLRFGDQEVEMSNQKLLRISRRYKNVVEHL